MSSDSSRFALKYTHVVSTNRTYVGCRTNLNVTSATATIATKAIISVGTTCNATFCVTASVSYFFVFWKMNLVHTQSNEKKKAELLTDPPIDLLL